MKFYSAFIPVCASLAVSTLITANLLAGENAFLAQPDYIDDPANSKGGFTLAPSAFTANDGIVRYYPTTVDDKLLENHSADAHLDSSLWENSGYGAAFFDYKFSGSVSLEAVSSAHAGISYAYKLDESANSYLYIGSGTSTDGYQDYSDVLDDQSATFEFWIKLTPDDLSGNKNHL